MLQILLVFGVNATCAVEFVDWLMKLEKAMQLSSSICHILVFSSCKGRKFRTHRGIPILASSLPSNRYPSRVLSPKAASSLDRDHNARMKRRAKSMNEDDTLFDLDGFHESKNCEPFFESDDDSSGMFVLFVLFLAFLE